MHANRVNHANRVIHANRAIQNGPFATAAACKSHASQTPCEHKTGVRMVFATRAMRKPLRRRT
eukprot:5961972-Lingulodinium_polyedra.AAC.1